MLKTAEPRPVVALGLTDRGRGRAVLLSLDARWDTLTVDQRAEARALVERLAAVNRAARVRRVAGGARG